MERSRQKQNQSIERHDPRCLFAVFKDYAWDMAGGFGQADVSKDKVEASEEERKPEDT